MGTTDQVKEQLAHESMFVDDEDENENADKYLLFNLGHDIYGLDIMSITEIIEMSKITAVPDLPSFIKGVVNLRGHVVPIMDLRLRLRMPERDYDDRTCIIIAHSENRSIGIIVDTVVEVLSINNDAIEPAPDFGGENEKRSIVDRIGKSDKAVTLLVDVHQLMDAEFSVTLADTE